VVMPASHGTSLALGRAAHFAASRAMMACGQEHPEVVPHAGQTKQDPARCMTFPHSLQ